MNPIKRIKGTQDILPEEAAKWTAVEQSIRSVMRAYNYHEMRTPVFEKTELFARGIGQLTDIVSKEMYTFFDRGKKQITLKPEMTAPIIRAYLENKLYASSPLNKLYYIAPLFRQENPQAGRLRQFHQFGAECLGSADALADVEIIDLAMSFYEQIGIQNIDLKINSVGDPECRIPYKKRLQDYIHLNLKQYCEDCQRRFDDNPMRILDCKNETCSRINKQAPKLSDHLCENCSIHYSTVKSQLKDLGWQYSEDPYLVRGLDYYTRTVFEITSGSLGAQNAICGGGRYDLLSEELGGQPTPAVGFASGIERLLMVAEAQSTDLGTLPPLDIFIATMGQAALHAGQQWLQKFRREGYLADQDFMGRSLKAQMREANRQNARFVLILGEDELNKQEFSVKDMFTGSQESIAFNKVMSFTSERLKQALKNEK